MTYRHHIYMLSCAISLVSICFCAGKATFTISQPDTAANDDCPITTTYREWFFNPSPKAIIGYPRQDVSALQDAMIRIKGYSRMFVKGKVMYYHDGNYSDKQDSISFYFDENDTITTATYRPVDSFFVCCDKKIWLMLPYQEKPPDTANISPCSISGEGPRELQSDTGYLYGKGTYILHFYEQALSWMAAEETAIKALCQQSVVHMNVLEKSYSEGNNVDISFVLQSEMDLVVRNTSIISRYYDKSNNLCIVIAACKKADISPWKGK